MKKFILVANDKATTIKSDNSEDVILEELTKGLARLNDVEYDRIEIHNICRRSYSSCGCIPEEYEIYEFIDSTENSKICPNCGTLNCNRYYVCENCGSNFEK